ncbi:M20/M25/M40 family metallo-hydrolase [Algoriphagus zhangzhouensis]|uniref:PDZ domain-containing protein n=1 Tax=Algoriphagus zhangzhouensis TaxID=1073327 RepID=A0A1M7ZAF4_9BACT|nr:M20/M25/M40 family metallo-hydrolase [Algoriphagus zhangzhouensis]TDY47148.1 PDZ domain-containing protein [Algoriphagus zhangzhouensis]SHO61893.1 PDZ domain-containing protein [Algoriphagus zhangzhouensis]
MKIHHLYFSAILLLAAVSCNKAPSDTSLLADLKTDVYFLASDNLEGRSIGTDGEEKAAKYLAERFQKIGLTPKGTDGFFQEFTVSKPTNPHEEAVIGTDGEGVTGRNVVGYIDNVSDEIIVIGAHFDHLGMGGSGSLHRGDSAIHNGADDNASGTAALVALAEILNSEEHPYDFLFIAFSGEENGLWGSNYFVKNPTIDLEKVDYMINMDMVGRLNEENTLAINGVGTSPSFVPALDLVNSDSLKLVTSESGVGPSDHTSFYLQDLPVLHFFTGQHEDYHKPSDDAFKINYEGLLKVVRYIDRLVDQLDSESKLAFTKTKDDSGDSPRFTVSLGVVPDYLFDGKGMRIDGVSEDKPAKLAGLEKGDVVVQLGDSTIYDMMSYMRALSAFQKGDEAQVAYERDGKLIETKIKF